MLKVIALAYIDQYETPIYNLYGQKNYWLPFVPFKELSGIKHKTVEAIWSNVPTAFDNEQLTMFNQS